MKISHSFLLRRGWVTIPTRITRAIWLAISPVSSTVALSIIFQHCVSVGICYNSSTRLPQPVSVYVEISIVEPSGFEPVLSYELNKRGIPLVTPLPDPHRARLPFPPTPRN